MRVYNAPASIIETTAAELGFRCVWSDFTRFRLMRADKDAPYRIGPSGRKHATACFHVYSRFFARVFKQCPTARFQTTFGTVTRETLRDMYWAVRDKLVGPYTYGEMCTCTPEQVRDTWAMVESVG